MYLTVFGDRRVGLPSGWTKETVVSLVGDVNVDATAQPSPGASLKFVTLVGDAHITVPPGTRVTHTGVNVVGDRKVDVSPGDGREIRVSAYTLLGDLKVTESSDTL